jgi:hypothetical protein
MTDSRSAAPIPAARRLPGELRLLESIAAARAAAARTD